MRGDLAYLEATLPLRSGDGRKQQRIPLGKVSLAEAEFKAGQLGHQLRTSSFKWEYWQPEETTQITIGDFRLAARKLYEQKFKTETTWQKKWKPALNKLPPDSVLCTDTVLTGVVNTMGINTATRRDQGNILAQIAETLNISATGIRAAARGYAASELKPRDIPSDQTIEHFFKEIKLPHWRWMYGMCACFGLRPHEIIEAQLTKEGNCEVHENTKTGYRVAWPIRKAWIKQFHLAEVHRPTQTVETVAKAANDTLHDRGPLPFGLYNLRHAYAIRCMEVGIPADIACQLMGHSLSMHTQTYRRWLNKSRLTALRSKYDL